MEMQHTFSRVRTHFSVGHPDKYSLVTPRGQRTLGVAPADRCPHTPLAVGQRARLWSVHVALTSFSPRRRRRLGQERAGGWMWRPIAAGGPPTPTRLPYGNRC